MCDTCKNCEGNVGNIALAFKNNSVPVQAVFSKYGMGKMETTPYNAMVGTVAHKEPFLKEVSLAAAGISTSNYSADENEQNLDLAGQIFNILGTAANAGINIGKGIADIKNQNKPGNTQAQWPTQQTGQPQVVYVQQPNQPTPATGGFTTSHLVMLLLAATAIAVVVILAKGKKP